METQLVTTPDGRKLAYVELGDTDGSLVIHNHGGPGSRYEAQFFADAASRYGLRLICVDRPGMGRSSPQRARTYSGWATDLTAIADALGYQEFGVAGWSEGGPWALAATAYIEPTRLRHVSSIAPGSYGAFGDNSAGQYLSRIDGVGAILALHFTPGFRLMYAILGLEAKRFGGSLVKQIRNAVNAYDRQILLRPEIESAFAEEMAECFAQGSGGLVADAELLYRRWAFDVSRIERPVHLWQGLDDRLVPEPINKAVADRMPGAIWHPVEGAGHFVAIGCADEIFGIATRELAAG
ncbi:hydrolase [Mycobacterium sp. 852013-50091_SCH5140682]|uniref:alpha/beta fold hydrolase n=1 Tax=Mycobacterium sp. 852013-50091_SCH5140682 TaxID=1834109 RepID=UPI0007EBA299|nr:alpha/beta hydrolase [Mycobacterium sp. 852013-50091_SCH5140682]OBC02439.1 hydrolase [Mycobacterium sp. 852013-50091_SCH5140682]